MAPWPEKKGHRDEPLKIESADGPEARGDDDPAQLHNLTERLGELGRLLSQANDQVVSYLVHRESRAEAHSDDGATKAIAERLDALAEKLDELSAAPAGRNPAGDSDAGPASEAALESTLRGLREMLDQIASRVDLIGQTVTNAKAQDTVGPALAQLHDGINQQFASMAQGMQTVYQRLDAGLNGLAEQLAPEDPDEPSGFGPAVSSDWQAALLGTQLAGDPNLEFQRRRLFAGLLEDEPAACSLVGQLLVFRSAPAEKMPQLLKEIGEAYYRWQPKTSPGTDLVEEAIVTWLRATMQNLGIGNTIEMVNPGERFDSTRHAAAARGVEVTEVLGWIVLRDNGRVYTKASVVVQ